MFAVILAGGSGTRFWPLSREQYPKSLLTIIGDRSLIQETVARLSPLISVAKTWIVTNHQHVEQLGFQLSPRLPNFLVEPVARNTAAAIGLAALRLVREDPDAIMAVFPADHLIQNKAAFHRALRAARKAAQNGYLVTLGVGATRAESAYGYIQKGRVLPLRVKAETGVSSNGHLYEAARFVEKPRHSMAVQFLKDGGYLWNAGIFVWRASVILEEMATHLPQLYAGLQSLADALGTPEEKDRLAEIYPDLPAISIDQGVLERSSRVVVVPSEFDWSDVGSWSALDGVSEHDEAGNVLDGNVINVGSRDSIIYAGKRLVAAVGVSDLVVVDTDDATLVCSKESAQDVKYVVQALRDRNGEEHLVHRTVHRPWGSYTVLEKGPNYKIKRIEVKPKARLSLQMHRQRSEHWVVISGTAEVTCGQSIYRLPSNQSTFVPMGVQHRLENPEDEPLIIIEVQSGPYVEEDDIVRFEDDYGRLPVAQTV